MITIILFLFFAYILKKRKSFFFQTGIVDFTKKKKIVAGLFLQNEQ